jgi:2,3-bisphosphoglycerate-dependent phosphoglycerate mutase
MNLLYVRHGKTQGNAEKIYVGRIESPLLPEGIESGIRVGKQLHDSGEQV